MHEYWLDGFALWLRAQRRTPQTITKYRQYASRFLAAVGDGEITRFAIMSHMASFAARSRSHQANNYYGIHAFLRYLREEEGLDVPEMPGRAPKVSLPPVEVPSEAAVKKLIKACQTVRDEAIVRVLASTGMRLSECADIKVADLDLGDAPRVKVMGKGERPRYVPLSARTALLLRRYLRQRQDGRYAASGALWLGKQGPMKAAGIWWVVRAASRRAGVDIHPHQFRHAYCHSFQEGGGQVNELMHLVGWANLSQAARYARATLGDRAEARARDLAIGDQL